MPETAEPINWGALRTLAVAVGVREAARRMGVSENTAISRSRREQWLADPAVKAATLGAPHQKRTSRAAGNSQLATVPAAPNLTAAAAMAQAMAASGNRSRINLARGVEKGSSAVAKMSGEKILDAAHELKALVSSGDLLHGWSERPPVARIELRMTGEHSVNANHTDAIEVEWSDADPASLPSHG